MIINTKHLFKKQYIVGKLNRFDIVVRYIAVENFMKYNKIHRIYKIDCITRAKYVNSNFDLDLIESKKRFKNTILSFIENKKFDIDNPIEVYSNYNISDGIHRLAICLYLDIRTIAIKIGVGDPSFEYPNESYYRKTFNKKQFQLLLRKEQEILNKGI